MITTMTTTTSIRPKPAAGYAKIIGRVGALALFLGVGTAFAVPGVAHADPDGASSSSQESTSASSGSSRSSSKPASRASGPRKPAETTETAGTAEDASPPASTTPGASRTARTSAVRNVRGSRETADQVRSSKTITGHSDNRSKAPSDDADEPVAKISKPAAMVPDRAVAKSTTQSTETPPKDAAPEVISEQARPAVAEEGVAEAPKVVEVEPAPTAAPSAAPAIAPAVSKVADAVGDVVSAVFAPLAGAGIDPDAPGQSPVQWALLAYARRQVGTDTAVRAPGTATQINQIVAEQTLVNQASPLVTAEQLEAERIARATANSLPVMFMKMIVQHQFRWTLEDQFRGVGGPDAENLALLDEAVNQFAMFSSFTQQLINPMDPKFIWADSPAHSWFGMNVADSRYLYDNPDTIYRFTGVNANASYVITGRFNNYDPNDPEGTLPADTTFSVVEGIAGNTSSILTTDDLDIAPDGTFVITVSGDPAAPGQRNHIQLTSNSTVLLARNTLGDWNAEEPMSLTIAKVGGAPNSLFAQLGGFAFLGGQINDNPLLVSLVSLVPPLPIAEIPLVRGALTAIIMVVRGANEQAKYIALATTDPVTGAAKPANFIPQPTSNAEFLANQRQSIGNFQLADDEALVLTIDPGSADYFTVPVYNDYTTTTDFWNQQTSLNNEQTRMNPDGTYTVVISPTDPGVYNWVSTGGLNQGIIAARFQGIDESDPNGPRIVSHQVVKVSEVAGYYPDDPSYFVTEQQRAEQLALRKAGYDKRFAPYLQA